MDSPKPHLVHIVFMGATLLALIFAFENITAPYPTLPVKKPVAAEQKKQNVFFENLDIKAQGVLVWDIKRKRPLYEKNAESQLPLASLTKLMTAVLAAENLKNKTITIRGEDLTPEGDTGLKPGETWDILKLAQFTLTSSSNDGAFALANAVSALETTPQSFEEIMNRKAREIGMNQTFFANESGLDLTRGISGAYGSARDMATLLEYALRYYPEIFENTRVSRAAFSSEDGTRHVVDNTNEIVERLPGIVASKTGFTNLANGNLAVVFEAGPGYPIAVIALGSTRENRFSDVESLIWTTLESL